MRRIFTLSLLVLLFLNLHSQSIVDHPTLDAPHIPYELQGNWLRTDGSNQWEFGIYNDKVIYDNTLWENIIVKKRCNTYYLTLKKETTERRIKIKLKKHQLLIGDSRKNRHLYSTTITRNPTYVIENDEDFQLPIFHLDTAIYKGYINDYHLKMGNAGMVYVNDILTGNQYSYLIQIASNGSFIGKIPMSYPQTVQISMLEEINETVFLEPGKTLFHYINLLETTVPVTTLFMGELALLNTDLAAVDTIAYLDYEQLRTRILHINGTNFKDHCLYIMHQELSTLSEFTKHYPLSKKALQIKNFEIQYRMYQTILSYNNMRMEAYRQKYSIPIAQLEIPLNPQTFEPEYYDFLNINQLNNPISVVSGAAYYSLINRLQYSENIRPALNYVYAALKDSIVKNKIPMSLEEVRLLDNLINSKTNKRIEKVIASDMLTWEILKERHSELISTIQKDGFKETLFENMKTYYGIDKGFVKDIIYNQSINSTVNDLHKPLKEADKLFDAILSKYKGKVILVDFWATWCELCRVSIEQMRPLKEELNDTAIAFVYITNPSSPIDFWNLLITPIKGEHFRVTQDEWNHLKSKFNINSIPHYLLIDKNGKVVNDNFTIESSNEELKKKLETYLSN